MSDEERIQLFGEKGFANLKAQAELLNMSLDQYESIAELAPVALWKCCEMQCLKNSANL